jgi:hypothetical protein
MNKYGKDDFHGDNKLNNWDGESFQFHESVIFELLDSIKRSYPLLDTIPTEEIVEKYRKIFPPDEFGGYMINEPMLDRINSEFLNETLQGLVDRGAVELCWDESQQDFVFKLKDDNSL